MDSGKKKTSEDLARETFENWIEDLQEKEQPEVCTVDGEDGDCEACGS